MQMLGLGAPASGMSGSSSGATAMPQAAVPPRAPPGAPSFDLSALLASSGIAPAPGTTNTPGAFNLPPAPNSAGGRITVEDMQRAMQGGRYCFVCIYIFMDICIYTYIYPCLQPMLFIVNFSSGVSRQPPSNLADVVSSEEILNSGILEDPEVRTQLIELLPEGMYDC